MVYLTLPPHHLTGIHITAFQINALCVKWSKKVSDLNHFQHHSSSVQKMSVYQISSIHIPKIGTYRLNTDKLGSTQKVTQKVILN